MIDFRHDERHLSDRFLLTMAGELCRHMIDDLLILDRSEYADARYRIFGGDCLEADFCCNGALFALSMMKNEGADAGILVLEFFEDGTGHLTDNWNNQTVLISFRRQE